ncbi:hypoxanthine phosphoribosyltransferase [Mycoplasma todarodis]|uniref:Hypoxanthine phosphoribosyltransferase n=1 Tax=Mycoplasma todarodis TaxID=1937191 RepID=A0A4V2NHY9_9MOLU|nr:hypoxanthine phosphoribosyltransferase [Mycoplasma todarodis]TCG10678.1 hypoxanthine phosphoribosyltransferase [Mycoplasma todarodis]
MDSRIKEIIYTREEIETKIKELADWVNEEYKDSKDLVIIGLLKGSVPFLSKLMMDVTVDMSIDFMTVSSYGGSTSSTGNVKIVMDLKKDISGKDILIAEDIIDSGITLKAVMENLSARKPKSLKIITLMDKPTGRKVDLHADKVGLIVPDEFLVGYGLDVKEKMRNLPVIAVFNKEKLDEI